MREFLKIWDNEFIREKAIEMFSSWEQKNLDLISERKESVKDTYGFHVKNKILKCEAKAKANINREFELDSLAITEVGGLYANFISEKGYDLHIFIGKVTMELADFQAIAEYGNVAWKGSFTEEEVHQNAQDYKSEYDVSIQQGNPTFVMKELCKLMVEDTDFYNAQDTKGEPCELDIETMEKVLQEFLEYIKEE